MAYIILMCISHFMFFLPVTYCLLFILYLFWTREMMLGKRKFKQFSYLSSKWVIKQQRQFATSTTHLAQELLTNVQCSGGSRSFAKGHKNLEDEECSGQLLKVDNYSWEYHRSWSSCIYMRSCQRTQHQPFRLTNGFISHAGTCCLTSESILNRKWATITKVVID